MTVGLCNNILPLYFSKNNMEFIFKRIHVFFFLLKIESYLMYSNFRPAHTQNEYFPMSCFDSIVFNFKLLHLV